MSLLAKSPSQIPRHSFSGVRLEPVILLSNDKKIVRHWEVLCNSLPEDIKGWQIFYRDLISTCRSFPDEVKFAVNVDSDHVMDDAVWDSIQSIAYEKNCIALEWTEAASSFSIDEVASRLMNLKARANIELHLDDVGSGDDPMPKASLIHPDVIKIDGELFHRARTSMSAAAVIKAHIKCYQEFLSESVIEWIEDESDLMLARDLGADFGQGYHFK